MRDSTHRSNVGSKTFGVSESDFRAGARICMPTLRSVWRESFQCSLYEAQDVLAAAADVDLIDYRAGWAFRFRDRWQRRLLFRGVSPLAYTNPGLQKVQLTGDYDLFIAVCQNAWDLLYVNAIDGWKERCKVSVCWLGEIWASDIAACRGLLRALSRFDHIFVNSQGTVGPLSDFLNRQCHLLPTGIDTVRFSPFPNPPDRSIDVYSIGRRWEGVHRALLRAASEGQLFYIHDSFKDLARMEPIDDGQHRDLFANMAKRSKFFLVSPGKMNRPDETGGQVEIGYRYCEGAAAGTVMIGQPADCEAFRELFPWPDAVTEIKPDGSDTLDVLADLASNPARIAAISRRNAAESLLRHDWIHRWKAIFELSGIEPPPGMVQREAYLKGLASTALQTA
jgi:glycosyl transferase family 1